MDSNIEFKPNSRVASVTITRTIIENCTILVPLDTPEASSASIVKKAAIRAAQKAMFHSNDLEFNIAAIGSTAESTEVFYVDEDGQIEADNPLTI